MIQSWRSDTARAVFLGHSPKGFPADLVKRTRRVLAQLNAATEIAQMRIPPGNRLHALGGDRTGEWSVSVNDQFRITFRWGEDGPEDVWFGDYH
ncbi:type II toxin-antitoxin system RelE/ParE family toxin [Caulobacter endophyticus]|uniref:type II toxin-antitoxin system RelE/ParE family toxin n=1 Tax=Caulobacter endophyticus TaxID=2172652 RepID=UPI00240F8196|nr:type II toxin-antitoxin system RelE/ParE family toxin [Caulobacter endophyticus]MDG2530785.1 type II toxin-antitoxin system RelE/ParE family toxin [Caulobacter endophyticus]